MRASTLREVSTMRNDTIPEAAQLISKCALVVPVLPLEHSKTDCNRDTILRTRPIQFVWLQFGVRG